MNLGFIFSLIPLLSAHASAATPFSQTVDQFIQNERSIIDEQMEEKIRKAVKAAYPTPSNELECVFEMKKNSGQYKQNETRVDVLKSLEDKHTIYFNFQENGTKTPEEAVSGEVPVRNMHEWEAVMHQAFRNLRSQGYQYHGVCVSTVELSIAFHGTKEQALKVFLQEGMKAEEVHFQEEACPSEHGPVAFKFTEKTFDESLLSSNYEYDALTFSCKLPVAKKIESRSVVQIETAPAELNLSEVKVPAAPAFRIPKEEHPSNFYIKQTFLDRLRENARIRKSLRTPRERSSSFGCPNF